MKIKHGLVAGAATLLACVPGVASAAPIVGSFSIVGFSGTFFGGSQTALTATGLDFGTSGGTGNTFGTAGTATIGNATGSFAGLSGLTATISDIALGATASTLSSFYINFGGASNIVATFSNAVITRSTTGTSVTIAGPVTFTDGVAADATTGMFSLSANSQSGMPTDTNFTFTGNAGAVGVVPEPAAWAMMIFGMGAIGFALRRQKVATRVSFAA